MQKLIVLAGISGAGKSMYAAGYAAAHPGTVIVSTDAIREELLGDASDQSEPQKIFSAVHRRVRTALSQGKTVKMEEPTTFDDEDINEDNYRTTFEIEADPDEEADGLEDYVDE